MLDLFGRRVPQSGVLRLRAMSMGLWLVGGAVAMVGAMVSVESSTPPEPVVRVQAGPVDDTIDYLDCLIRLLQGLDCDDQTPDPAPTPDPTTTP